MYEHAVAVFPPPEVARTERELQPCCSRNFYPRGLQAYAGKMDGMKPLDLRLGRVQPENCYEIGHPMFLQLDQVIE